MLLSWERCNGEEVEGNCCWTIWNFPVAVFISLPIHLLPPHSVSQIRAERAIERRRPNQRAFVDRVGEKLPAKNSFEMLNRSSNKCITASLRTHHNRRRKKEATRKNDVVIKNINFQGMRAAKYKVTETSL